MSDPAAGPLEFRQRYADNVETVETHLDGRQAQIHTALPGHIVSYNAAKMTATVQVDIQAIRQQLDGTLEAMTIQPIHDVTVCFPGGGGHILTFPVKPGDDCLILFCERSIDNWFAQGGTQQPGDYRMHDMSDAVCFVGIRSQPKVLGGGASKRSSAEQFGTEASNAVTTLRSDDGLTLVQIDGTNKAVTLYATMSATTRAAGEDAVVHVDGMNNVVNLKAGTTVMAVGGSGNDVSIGGTAAITFTCPTLTVVGDLNVTGEIRAKSGGTSVTLSQHRHPGNNTAPTPGT